MLLSQQRVMTLLTWSQTNTGEHCVRKKKWQQVLRREQSGLGSNLGIASVYGHVKGVHPLRLLCFALRCEGATGDSEQGSGIFSQVTWVILPMRASEETWINALLTNNSLFDTTSKTGNQTDLTSLAVNKLACHVLEKVQNGCMTKSGRKGRRRPWGV